jgi:hypothetical protein
MHREEKADRQKKNHGNMLYDLCIDRLIVSLLLEQVILKVIETASHHASS